MVSEIEKYRREYDRKYELQYISSSHLKFLFILPLALGILNILDKLILKMFSYMRLKSSEMQSKRGTYLLG